MQFVIAGSDATELFELVEESLDAVAPSITLFVVKRLLAATGHGGNHRFDAVECQTLPNAVGIVTPVQGGGLQDVVRVEALIERFKLPAVVCLPCGYVQRDGAVFVDRGGMDFRGKSPARPPQSLLGTLFFGAPAACGWARTVVESMSRSRAAAKGSACRSRHKRCQTPRSVHRRNRM